VLGSTHETALSALLFFFEFWRQDINIEKINKEGNKPPPSVIDAVDESTFESLPPRINDKLYQTSFQLGESLLGASCVQACILSRSLRCIAVMITRFVLLFAIAALFYAEFVYSADGESTLEYKGPRGDNL